MHTHQKIRTKTSLWQIAPFGKTITWSLCPIALAILLFSQGVLGQALELAPDPDYQQRCQEFFGPTGFFSKQTDSGMTVIVGGNSTSYEARKVVELLNHVGSIASPYFSLPPQIKVILNSFSNSQSVWRPVLSVGQTSAEIPSDVLPIIEVGFNALTVSLAEWEEMGCPRSAAKCFWESRAGIIHEFAHVLFAINGFGRGNERNAYLDELFADLFAAIILDSPDAMVHELQSDVNSAEDNATAKARSFTDPRPPSGVSFEPSKHTALWRLRAPLWEKYFRKLKLRSSRLQTLNELAHKFAALSPNNGPNAVLKKGEFSPFYRLLKRSLL